jgi:hypothetical protein
VRLALKKRVENQQKKSKKDVDKSINQLIGFLLFELPAFISIKKVENQ